MATADFIDGRSKTWQERLDWRGFGQRTQAIDPLGHTEIALATFGTPLSQSWSYTLDNLGRVIAATDGVNNTTNYTYDGAGNLRTVTDPLNHTTTYGYKYRSR